jgi:hypothetical protein
MHVLFLTAFAVVSCDRPSKVPSAVASTTPAASPLTATAVSPNSGPADLATEIRIAGTGFQQGATLTWDGLILNIATMTSTTITATAPTHAAGTVSLVVTNPDGRAATLASAYTYLSPTFAVTGVRPAAGLTADIIWIEGIGFHRGATVTLDGMPLSTGANNGASIFARAPFHQDGPVDIVVTNPGGQSRTLRGGFTYGPVTLTVSSTTVTPRGTLAVSWAVPNGRVVWDWIGLFEVGEANEDWINNWWQYTYGAASGTFTLNAPPHPGRYEFRFFADYQEIDHKRSASITVTAEQSGARR